MMNKVLALAILAYTSSAATRFAESNECGKKTYACAGWGAQCPSGYTAVLPAGWSWRCWAHEVTCHYRDCVKPGECKVYLYEHHNAQGRHAEIHGDNVIDLHGKYKNHFNMHNQLSSVRVIGNNCNVWLYKSSSAQGTALHLTRAGAYNMNGQLNDSVRSIRLRMLGSKGQCKDSVNGIDTEGVKCQWPESHLKNCAAWSYNCAKDANMRRCCQKTCGMCWRRRADTEERLSFASELDEDAPEVLQIDGLMAVYIPEEDMVEGMGDQLDFEQLQGLTEDEVLAKFPEFDFEGDFEGTLDFEGTPESEGELESEAGEFPGDIEEEMYVTEPEEGFEGDLEEDEMYLKQLMQSTTPLPAFEELEGDLEEDEMVASHYVAEPEEDFEGDLEGDLEEDEMYLKQLMQSTTPFPAFEELEGDFEEDEMVASHYDVTEPEGDFEGDLEEDEMYLKQLMGGEPQDLEEADMSP